MKKLENFTPAEIKSFDMMHKVLTDYNNKVATDEATVMDRPLFGPVEIEQYSLYRELLTYKEVSEDPF